MTIADIALIELIRPPWRRYVVESRLPRELVVRALGKSVQRGRWFGRRIGPEPFQGTINPEGFRIRRASQRGFVRWAAPILIIGRFAPSPYGTRIAVTIRPVLPQLAFWLIAIAAVALIGILAAAKALRGDASALGAAPIVVASLAYLYLVASVFFALRVRKVKPLLDAILTGAQTASKVSPTL